MKRMKLNFASLALAFGPLSVAAAAQTPINGEVGELLKGVRKEAQSMASTPGQPSAAESGVIALLRLKSPDAPPFQILKEAFDQSKDPIQPQDVGASRQQCASAAASEAAPAPDALVTAVSHKTIVAAVPDRPATPSQGPLFPGKPAVPGSSAQIAVKTFIITGSPGQGIVDSVFDNIVVENDRTQLITRITATPAANDTPLSLSVRKSGNLITYSLRTTVWIGKISKGESVRYGYCWD